MADKNDAREWLEKWYEATFPRRQFGDFVTMYFPEAVDALTAYAAAVTQERDALRRALQIASLDAVGEFGGTVDETFDSYMELATKADQP